MILCSNLHCILSIIVIVIYIILAVNSNPLLLYIPYSRTTFFFFVCKRCISAPYQGHTTHPEQIAGPQTWLMIPIPYLRFPTLQAPADFMLYGYLGAEPIGLALIDGYHLKVLRLESLFCKISEEEFWLDKSQWNHLSINSQWLQWGSAYGMFHCK